MWAYSDFHIFSIMNTITAILICRELHAAAPQDFIWLFSLGLTQRHILGSYSKALKPDLPSPLWHLCSAPLLKESFLNVCINNSYYWQLQSKLLPWSVFCLSAVMDCMVPLYLVKEETTRDSCPFSLIQHARWSFYSITAPAYLRSTCMGQILRHPFGKRVLLSLAVSFLSGDIVLMHFYAMTISITPKIMKLKSRYWRWHQEYL